MAKKNWGKPAYKGKPDPLKAANIVMFIVVLLLVIGFLKVAMREGWISNISNFISQQIQSRQTPQESE